MITAREGHLVANQKAISGRLDQIKACKADIAELEKLIADLQKKKAKVLQGMD